MDHIAIDLGGRKSRICVCDEKGIVVEEQWWATSRLGEYLKKRPAGRVVLETSAEAFAVAETATQLGHQVRVVPATLVKSLGVGVRRVKTDKKDARALSEVSCRIDLPSVHIPSKVSQQWKALCSSRDCLVTTRTKLINHVRGLMRTQVKHVRSGSIHTFAKRVRHTLERTPEGLPIAIERELRLIEELNQLIAETDDELKAITSHEPRCRKLMTVPGVGPVTALRFVATIDEVSRFGGAHAVQSYLGLTPGQNSSSDRERRTSITKAGSPVMRWLLVQAAWCALRTRPKDPMVQWAAEVARRRGPQVAAVALSRKLAGILYAILRDGTDYQPSRGAQRLTA